MCHIVLLINYKGPIGIKRHLKRFFDKGFDEHEANSSLKLISDVKEGEYAVNIVPKEGQDVGHDSEPIEAHSD